MEKIYLILVVVLLSCNKDSRKELDLEKRNFTGNEIRIDGVYYYENNDEVKFFVFYRNGVVFGGFGILGDLMDLKNYLLDSMKVNKDRALVYSWGVFQVNDNSLQIEKWISTDGGPYPTRTYDATIRNDTTLVFDLKIFNTMKFEKFSPKPDSTNEFTD